MILIVLNLSCQLTSFRQDSVWSIAIAPAGRWVASSSYDKTIRIWDIRNGVTQCVLLDTEVAELVYAVDFSRVGSFLASGADNGVVKIWKYSSIEKDICSV